MRTTNNASTFFLAALSMMIFVTAFPLHAVADTVADEASSTLLEEVIVTATRTGESDLQDTPLSITAYTATMLAEGDLKDISDLARYTPGMEISANANIAQVTIRGIGSNTTLSGGETSASIQLDGVYIGRPSTALFDFINVDRIEVLRGPQGTLYGRNATAGTINIITADPAESFTGQVDLSYGSYNYLRFNSTASGPLANDRITAAISLQKKHRDGYVDNLYPGTKNDVGGLDRLQLQTKFHILITDALKLKLSADYTDIDETTIYYTKPLRSTGLGESIYEDIHQVALDFNPVYEHQAGGASGTLIYEINNSLTVSSISAWRRSDMSLAADLDATEVPFLRTDPLPEYQSQISQELQFNFSNDGLKLVSGVYYFKEEVDSYFFLKIFPLSVAQMQGRDVDTSAWAVYGESTYDLNDTISLTAGIRYSEDKKNGIGYGGFYAVDVGLLPAPQFINNESADFNGVTPKLGAHFRITEDFLAYISATKGYKAGGFNFITTPGENSRFDKETVWAYEIGTKNRLASGKVTLNAALFYNDYENLQIIEFLGAGTERVRNATDASIYGAEFELVAQPGQRSEISGSIAYLDAVYDGSFTTLDPIAGTVIDADGNRLNNAPEWSGSITTSYYWNLSYGTLRLRGEISYRDEVFYSPSNNDYESQAGFALVNTRLTFITDNNKAEISLHCENLTDKEYITGAAFFIGPVGRPALGRTIGAQLRYLF